MQSLANGTELGAYTIVRLIGRGGMGEVYEAYERRLQRRVALKVIAPQKAGSHGEVDLVRRFLQEARTLAQINHPNVVTIYAIDRIEDTQFIAMEFVDGASFKDLFSMFALSADESITIFMQLLEGLRALHESQILHRDIKPHNLMIRPNGQIKILDFGIAKRLGDRERENTTVGVVVGTLSYLPPEVLYGSPATVRSDLWSMGAIFYECLVGQPLVSMTTVKVKGARAAADSDVIFPQESLTWIPQDMRVIVARLCDRRPEQRYESAAQVIDALKRFQLTRPPVTPSSAQALFQAVAEMEDLKEGTDVKKLNSAKSKRDFTVAVLGGNMQTVVDMPLKLEDEPVVSEILKDSISARRKAQSQSRHKRRKWQTPTMIAAGLVVVLSLVGKAINHKAKESVKKPDVVALSMEVPRLTSPAENQALWLDPTQLPTLAWSKAVGPGEFELQIASDANFNSIVMREGVSGTSYRPARILNEGNYFWQLWPLHGSLKPVGPAEFTVSFLAPLEMTWPKADQTFDLGRGIKSRTLNFKWSCKPGAKTYGAQVSSDPAFTEIVGETIVNSCAWNDIKLPPGTYYWRVRVEEPPVAQASTSAKQSFTIKGGGAPAPAAPPVATRLGTPRLKNGKQNITLHFAKHDNLRDPASLRKQMLEVPELKWQPVRGARAYELQISWSADFSRLLSEENVTATSYEWRQAVAGKLYWRVRAVTDVAGPYSAPGLIQVNLPEPVLNAEYKLTERTPLEWEPVPLADKYVVQYSAVRTMASVSEKITADTQYPIEVSEAPTFVRVAAANAAGERVSGFSQVSTITLEAPLKLAAPGLVTPPKGAKVAVGRSGRISVVFSWNRVENTSTYFVEISGHPDFSKMIQKKGVRSTKWVLKGAKFNGKIYWRVRSQGENGPSPWSSTGFFEVHDN